jgi:hypothetical protein
VVHGYAEVCPMVKIKNKIELRRINATGEVKKPDRLSLVFFSEFEEDGLSEIILVMIFDFYFE